MHTGGRLIERYILRAILPYLLLSLLLLTTILLTQQASRFAELLVGAGMPLKLVAEVALALIPNVLVFALPIAVLAGTVIGFSRLGSDSEMVTMRAAGVGTWSMLWPVLLLGAALSCLTLYINLWEAPQSAHSLRRTALSAALYKMDSPVEPRAFNVDIPGYVVYVRDGDKAQGQWGRVFIYSQEKDGSNRLITARSGRIDSAAEQSELVLSDAVATKIPAQRQQPGGDAYVVERLAQLRVQFNTGRAALLEKIRQDEREADELDWFELGDYAAHRGGAAARDAWTLWHKRLTLSLSPLVFALLGTGLGLRVRKGGRGLGMLVSLLVLISYYLVSLLCEQMARAGTLSVSVGAWISTALALICGVILLANGFGGSKGWLGSLGFVLPGRWRMDDGEPTRLEQRRASGWARRTRLLSFPSLLDLSVLRALWLSFAFSLIALTAIFLIFTLFELWRFIALTGAGARLIMKYMLFLLPLISVQLLPASVLLSVLAAYALMSRRSESIAWWACGQSVYRLMLPGILFAAITGGCLWLVQERLMPEANTRQDALRAQIRGGPLRATTKGGRQWLASPESGRLYSYTYDEEGGGELRDLAIYEFDGEGVHLTRAIKAQTGWWTKPDSLHLSGVESLLLKATKVEVQQGEAGEAELTGAEPPEAFKPTADKPSQLSAKGLSAYIKQMKRRGSLVGTLAVALQHKYAEPFSPLVMALLGIPLAFSFGRRSAIAALCSAIGIGLAFWGVSGGFQQLGSYGLLPPAVAAWSPLVIFAAIGAYLLSRART